MKYLNLQLFSALLFSAVFFLPNFVLASSMINDDLENYNLGAIAGQGNWSGGYFDSEYKTDFVSSPVKTGSVGMLTKAHTIAPAVNTMTNPTNDLVNLDFWVINDMAEIESGYNDVGFKIVIVFQQTSGTGSTDINFCESGATTRSIKFGSVGDNLCTGGFGTMNADIWYNLNFEVDYVNDTIKVQIDDGSWSSTYPIPATALYPNSVQFNTHASDDDIVFDDFGDTSYDYEAWGESIWNQFYFHSPIPIEHYIVPGSNYDDPDNYVFSIGVGDTEQPIWMFHHDGIYHDAEYYEDYITLEVLDAMQGSITYTHIVDTDIYFMDDSDSEVMIFYSPGALADTVQKHFALRFHNLADDEDYAVIYFTLEGDTDYWHYGDTTPYNMCESYDSAWTKAICHMIVPAPGFFQGEYAKLRGSFEDAFPFIKQIEEEVRNSSSEMLSAGTDAPTVSVSDSWNGASIQLWDMSVISPYMITFRGYISIVIWILFMFFIMREILFLLRST